MRVSLVWLLVRCPWQRESTSPCPSSQSDTEQADLAREKRELLEDPEAETEELTQIYVKRGVERDVARKVARQLMSKDALGAHARDELGLSEITSARPVQAALTSAASFSIGAAAPLALVLLSPSNLLIPIVSVGSLVSLALLGLLGARTGGAAIFKPIIRVTFWGALAMAVTARNRRPRWLRCLSSAATGQRDRESSNV